MLHFLAPAGGERVESGIGCAGSGVRYPTCASSNGISVDRSRICRFTNKTARSARNFVIEFMRGMRRASSLSLVGQITTCGRGTAGWSCLLTVCC